MYNSYNLSLKIKTDLREFCNLQIFFQYIQIGVEAKKKNPKKFLSKLHIFSNFLLRKEFRTCYYNFMFFFYINVTKLKTTSKNN